MSEDQDKTRLPSTSVEKIYSVFLQRWQAGETLDIETLCSILPHAESSKLRQLHSVQNPESQVIHLGSVAGVLEEKSDPKNGDPAATAAEEAEEEAGRAGMDERAEKEGAGEQKRLNFPAEIFFTRRYSLRKEVARGGMAVILGRGAPFILPPEQALRVLVVAPTPARVERLVKAHGLSTEEAARRLEQEDQDRLAFLRHQFGVEPDDPRLYDLVVNTGTLSIDAAAALVVEALRRRFPADRRTEP